MRFSTWTGQHLCAWASVLRLGWASIGRREKGVGAPSSTDYLSEKETSGAADDHRIPHHRLQRATIRGGRLLLDFLSFFLFFYLRARLNFPLIYTVEPGERAHGGAGWRILLRFPKGKIQFLCWSAGLKKNCYWSGISGLTVFCLMGDIFLEKHSWFPRSLQSWPASGK